VVVNNDRYLRPIDINWLHGDSTKAKQILKWEPKVTFKELCGNMVQKDIERWQAHLNGKIFPWDAINDPSIY
jgi:GDPmannose 4,6-dehydratase